MAAILADDIFKCIFLNEYDGIPIQISLKFVPGSPIDNNKTALVQLGNGLLSSKRQAITWTNADTVHWRLYAAQGGGGGGGGELRILGGPYYFVRLRYVLNDYDDVYNCCIMTWTHFAYHLYFMRGIHRALLFAWIRLCSNSR